MSFTIENNIIKTETLNFNCDGLGGVGNVVFNYMKKHGTKIAQVDANTGETDTFESLLRRSIRTAIVLKNKGIKKGDIVTGCSDNHLNACVPIIASFLIGAIPCSLDPTLSIFEINQLLEQVRPKVVFTVLETLEIIKNALKDAELKSEVVVFGTAMDHIKFDMFLLPQENEEEFEPVFVKNAKETAIIYFSSGTSGFPKGVCLSHYYLFAHSPLLPPAKNLHVDEERRTFELSKRKGNFSYLNYGSMYWVSAGMGLFLSAITGICRLLCNKFDAKDFWYLVEKYKVCGVFLTPFQVTELVKSGKPDDVDMSCLIRISTGGAALSKKYVFALQKLLPDTDIIPTYAQTETGMLAAFQIHNKIHRDYYTKNPETVGQPVRGVWYKVVNTDSEEALGPNQEGELRVKSDSIMNGYYKRDFSNRYDEEGWFRTGDIVKYDKNCYFYVVDRLKEMLKYRGWHIPPAIVELHLMHHPAVKQAVVIGKPHEEDGDHPMAIIVLEENAKETTPEDIEKYIEEKVQDKQKLRGGVKFVKKIPMTPSGKVKRRELRRMVLDKSI